MRGDGDGWTWCGQGHRHWGRQGAAGLLLRAVDDQGVARVLLQHREAWSHDGDTWGVPGGARDAHESPAAAALREAAEETGLDPADVRVRETYVDDHGDWSYVTVLADTPRPVAVTPMHESADVRWVAEHEVGELPLHPGFAVTWPLLRARPVTVLVDTANVVGSRADGWWRDRAAATGRLVRQTGTLRARVARLPDGERVVVRRVVHVLEGRAREAADLRDDRWPETAAADGEGDDLLVELAGRSRRAAEDVVAVTADQGLRARLDPAAGMVGPRWLLALLAV